METYIPLITGSGGALAVLMLWLTLILAGKLHTEQEFFRFSGIGEACG